MNRFIRMNELTKKVGLSRTTIWRQERIGLFPRRRLIASNSVAWLEAEIDQWMQSRQYPLNLSQVSKLDIKKTKFY